MKTFRLLALAVLVPALLPIAAPAAFDTPETESTVPDMSLAFPFEQRGEQVVNTLPVLINPGCLIPAGTVFLTIFVPPRPEDGDVVKKKQENSQEAAYSRRVQLPDKQDSLSPAQKAAYDRATRDPWKSHMIYRAALKQFRFDEMRLVFLEKGSTHSALEAFNLPEGMFLAQEGNEVKVLAVQKDSAAQKLGITAGCSLQKINGQSLGGSLAQFQKLYYPEKKISHESGKPLEIAVQFPGGAGSKDVVFNPPKKLNLNDFFSASDVSKEPAKKAQPAEPAPDSGQPENTAPVPPAP